MVAKSNTHPDLYLLKCEYDEEGEGIWHALCGYDASDVDEVEELDKLAASQPVTSSWKTPKVQVELRARLGSFLLLDNCHFAVDEATSKRLTTLLADSVEWLPFDVAGESNWDDDTPRPASQDYPHLFAMHALRSVSLAPNAEAEYFEGTNGISEVIRYAFNAEDVRNLHLFRVVGDELIYLVSGKFRAIVAKNKLRGLKFEPIDWAAG